MKLLLWPLIISCVLIQGQDIRCRSCGEYLSEKSSFRGIHDTSQATGSRTVSELGSKAQVHQFSNAYGVEFELATFSKADADVELSSSNQHSFFPTYTWRILYCSRCKSQVGFYFRHSDIESCEKDDQDELPETVQNVELIVEKALKDKCLTVVKGWWTYKYCYNVGVEQYHQDGKKKIQHWSMGKFSEAYLEESVDENGLPVEIVGHKHTGGQHCDENQHLRSTETRFECCKEVEKGIHIRNIKEPETCAYLMTICIPDLCPGVNAAKVPTLETGAEISGLCRRAFTKKDIPADFFALIWPNVVMEGSPELDWVDGLKTCTALT